MKKTEREPGTITRVPLELYPGLSAKRKRTVLDPRRVFVVVDGKEVSLAKALKMTGGGK
ncbi:MAG TPA: hypothetical protein VEA69_22955 [Tepidisphaeraceae bacterium]|nr:hypothetical protein [Tepidisphaeraceae bacterium]